MGLRSNMYEARLLWYHIHDHDAERTKDAPFRLRHTNSLTPRYFHHRAAQAAQPDLQLRRGTSTYFPLDENKFTGEVLESMLKIDTRKGVNRKGNRRRRRRGGASEEGGNVQKDNLAPELF